MSHKVLVACVGNIFLGDDAFGIEVAKRLARRPLLEGVSVVDYGIRSYDLAYALMRDWDQIILVDAVPRGAQPGTLYTMEPELDQDTPPAAIDAHSMTPAAVLQLVSALGGNVKRMVVVGCEPGCTEPDPKGEIGLSAPVSAAVDEAIRMIEELITRARSGATAA